MSVAVLPSSSFSTMISVTVISPDIEARLLGFPAYAAERLQDTVEDGTEYGARVMTSLVPRSGRNRLRDAVYDTNSVITPNHFRGTVGVDPARAPHARYVDQGTGVDGPFGLPVIARGKVMTFQKRGEPRRFRTVVKHTPSLRIQRSKNFSGKTHVAMREWTRLRTSVLSKEYAHYFAAGDNDTTVT